MLSSQRSIGFLSFSICAFVFVSPGWSQEVSMPGDLNGDHEVSGVDLFLYSLNFDPGGYRASPEADNNQDFHVDHRDLFLALLARLRGLVEPPIFDPTQVGTVEGVVLQDVGDALVVIPIPGAEVWIGLPNGFRYVTVADDNGQFRFESVPAGLAFLRAGHPGYHPGEASVEVVAGDVVQVTLTLAPRRGDLADVVGFVYGLVDPVSGESIFNDRVPIPGATVRVMPLLDGGVVPENLDPSHNPGSADADQVAFTDERGHYRLHDLPLGAYLMVVFAPGFESERREIIVDAPGDHLEDFLLTPFDNPSGRVAGRVFSTVDASTSETNSKLESSSQPLPGAVVSLEPLYDWGGQPQPGDPNIPLPFPYYQTITNESGEYAIRNVLPGLYHARAWAPEHEPQEAMVEVVEEETTRRDFHLRLIVIERGNLAGQVFGATQNLEPPVPLPNAVVAVFPWFDSTDPAVEGQGGIGSGIIDPGQLRSTTTDDEGNYFLEGLPVGNYPLLARAQGWGKATDTIVIIVDSTTTANLVITYTPPPPPGTLQGTVFSVTPDTLGLPVPIGGATVLAFPAHPELIDALPPAPVPLKLASTFPDPMPPEWEPFRTETNDNGDYIFPSLPPGPYRVVALADGHRPVEQLVRVPSGQTVDQDFYLQKIVDTYGLVLGKVYATRPDGQTHPIGGAKVSLESIHPIPIPYPGYDEAGFPVSRFETMTNADGHFEFPQIPIGLYVLCVQADGFRLHKSDVFVEAGQETTVEVELFPQDGGHSAAIEGHVWQVVRPVVGDGPERLEPIFGAIVTAVPLCGADAIIFTDPNGILPGEEFCLPRLTRTGPDGFYRIEDIASGPVIVIVVADGFEPGVEQVFVEPGQTRILDFFLASGGVPGESSLFGQISQRTEFPTFAPVPVVGAEVRIQPADIGQPLPVQGGILAPTGELVTTTDDHGFYRFPNLLPGSYRLTVEASGFLPIENYQIHIPPGQRIRQDLVLQPLLEGEGRLHGTVYQVRGNGPDPTNQLIAPDRIPAASAIVRLVPEGLAIIEIFPPPNVGFDRITDESGTYDFETLPAGWYHAYVLKEGFVPAFDSVLIRGGEEKERDFYLQPVQEPITRIEGAVIEDSGLLPVWLPISGSVVQLTDSLGDIRETHTNDAGHFAFERFSPGVYHLTVEASGYHTQMREGLLFEGQTAFESFALQRKGEGNASVRGRVQEDTGFLDVWIPIGGATVSLSGPPYALGVALTTTTDAEGRFVFEDIPPGDYGLQVQAEGYHSQNRQVELLPGESEHVLFELKSKEQGDIGNVEGQVTAVIENGEPFPIPGAPVFLSSADGTIGADLIAHSVVTDEMGHYRFEGVPAGEVTVSVGFPGEVGPSQTVEVPPGGTAIANFVLDPSTIPIPF